MLRRRSTGTLAGLLAAALLTAAALLAPGCSDGPETPEELFELGVATVADPARHGEFWDLLTREQQRQYETDMTGVKDTYRRNPGARGFVKQYHVTWEQFDRMTPRDIFTAGMKDYEHVIRGARIVDTSVDPVGGTDVLITFETAGGQQFRWVMRREEGRGWRLQNQFPVKLPDPERGR